ncbi:PH-like domain superfamily [Sesbania bispinosa]|nr:PH-like domain superfamily [Sesbania bispinosa]
MEHKKATSRKSSSFAFRIHEHVKLGPKLSETLKGKLSLGARIIQEGGRGNIFKHIFGMQDGEKLLKASQCYLYTTAGPIAGVLFISTKKVAFCSERPITCSSADGELVRVPYKVLIPIGKIKEVNEGENVNQTEQKYIEIVTQEDSEFWFMGFLRYEKAFKNLKKAISMPI